MRTRKRFKLSTFFNDLPTGEDYDTRLNLINVRTRIHIQREDGLDREIDIMAEADDDRGFTEDALALCQAEGIGWSTELADLEF